MSTICTSKPVKALIHFTRPGKGESLYTENLLSDDGSRLDTRSDPERDLAIAWSRRAWQPGGMLTEEQVIATVCKHHFYHEWFGIMQLFDAGGKLLGSYCDILTPLEKRAGEYYLTDLFLDLWIAPHGICKELDWDEFEEAAHQGLLSKTQVEKAAATLRRLVQEVHQGRFPNTYLPPEAPPPICLPPD